MLSLGSRWPAVAEVRTEAGKQQQNEGGFGEFVSGPKYPRTPDDHCVCTYELWEKGYVACTD